MTTHTMSTHDVFDGIAPIATGYESLGSEVARDVGQVGYCRLPDGRGESCLVVVLSPGTLTQSLKVKALTKAAEIVGGSIEEKVRALYPDMLKRAASDHVHKSAKCRVSQYVGCADSHKALEGRVSYTLESADGSVPAHLFAIIESE